MLITLILAGCSNAKYDEAMDNGVDSIKNEEYEKAAEFFEEAIEEKDEDDKASTYLKQTNSLNDGIEAMEDGDFEEAATSFGEIEEFDDGLSEILDIADEKQVEIEKLETLHADMEDVFNEAEEKYDKGEYQDALEKVEEALDNDLSHAYMEDIEEDLSKLESDIESNQKLKKKAAKVYEEVENLIKEEEYEEATTEIEEILDNDFDQTGLEASKKDLKELKQRIGKKEKEKEEQEVLDDLTGYWAEDADDNMVGKVVFKINSEETMWAVLNSGSAGYNEVSSIDVSESKEEITINTSEEESIKITDFDKKQMTLDGTKYRKVSEEEMQEILDSTGGKQTVDELFDAENIKKIEDFHS